MATIRKEFDVAASADAIWDALKDIGALHTRLAPGFVVNTTLRGNVRTVTFGNGMVVEETIIGVDDAQRRIAYTAAAEQLTHHSASAQVFDLGGGKSRFVWIADLLPDAAAETIDQMMSAGAEAMKAAAER